MSWLDEETNWNHVHMIDAWKPKKSNEIYLRAYIIHSRKRKLKKNTYKEFKGSQLDALAHRP